jgi:hypothetical protein
MNCYLIESQLMFAFLPIVVVLGCFTVVGLIKKFSINSCTQTCCSGFDSKLHVASTCTVLNIYVSPNANVPSYMGITDEGQGRRPPGAVAEIGSSSCHES